MRVTNLMMTNNVIQHLEENISRVNTTQEQISTGKQYQIPSEDPINASLSMQLKSSLRVSEGYQQTASSVKDWMSTTDTCLKQLEDLAIRASNIVLSGLNDTMDATERKTSLAPEVTEMINQAVDLGNAKYQDNYIFAGVRVDQPAFVVKDASTIEYQGISKTMMRSIGQANKLELNIDGNSTISPLINALVQARDSLDTNDKENLANSLDAIKDALSKLTEARTSNGTHIRQVENTISNLEKTDISIKKILSEKEDTNMAEAASLLQSQENTYQAVLEVGSRTLSALNLFDYMH